MSERTTTAADDEIGGAVVLVASDDSSCITGVELFVDGGMRKCRRFVAVGLAWRVI
jgi:hypothetical protein